MKIRPLNRTSLKWLENAFVKVKTSRAEAKKIAKLNKVNALNDWYASKPKNPMRRRHVFHKP